MNVSAASICMQILRTVAYIGVCSNVLDCDSMFDDKLFYNVASGRKRTALSLATRKSVTRTVYKHRAKGCVQSLWTVSSGPVGEQQMRTHNRNSQGRTWADTGTQALAWFRFVQSPNGHEPGDLRVPRQPFITRNNGAAETALRLAPVGRT